MAEITSQTSDAPLRLPVRRIDGSQTGETVELNPALFGVEENEHVVYLAVKAELANKRQGTHATKTRGLVSGGGKKPWKQKGRGAARAGSTRSPVWSGGGTTFGPQPHYYLQRIPARMRRLARKVALSSKARGGLIDLVEDFDFDAPKTQRIAGILAAFGAADTSALIMVAGHRPHVALSTRNIPRVEVREALGASTYDIVRAKRILISKSALDALVGGLSGE
ncbi:MAG: 50S ribosomal protein L4 [Calditrichaeota bacterium]|nr:50S ribosomal protein L4 [Calditrichota bacterium]